MSYREGVSLWRWTAGLHVLGTRLWCDAARVHGVTFVSGADVPLGGTRATRIVATERTRKLLGLDGEGVLPALFARPFALGRARLELLPAGRLPGSAQLRVELDGRVALYAGAVARARLAEPVQVRGCDELVLDARGWDAVSDEEKLLKALRGGAGEVGVASLWQAAELAALLDEQGVPVQTAPRLRKLLLTYARLGVAVPELHKAGVKIVLGPAPLRYHSGADLAALVEFAVATGAEAVWIAGGFSDPVAAAFARKKVRVSPIGPPQQVPLFS
jgi:hypothetical protein